MEITNKSEKRAIQYKVNDLMSRGIYLKTIEGKYKDWRFAGLEAYSVMKNENYIEKSKYGSEKLVREISAKVGEIVYNILSGKITNLRDSSVNSYINKHKKYVAKGKEIYKTESIKTDPKKNSETLAFVPWDWLNIVEYMVDRYAKKHPDINRLDIPITIIDRKGNAIKMTYQQVLINRPEINKMETNTRERIPKKPKK
jgi:hypothetical protein